MGRIFWGFCRNRFLMSPLHYLSDRSDFGFEFAEIFVFEKRLPDSMIRGVGDSPTQQYGESATLTKRGVGDSPTHRYGESTTLRITDTASFLLKNSIANSLYRWCGESLTPRISDAESRWLPVSLSRRVADSAYCWYGESPTPRIVESGSRFSNTNISENSKPKSERLEM